MNELNPCGYNYQNNEAAHTESYLWDTVLRELNQLNVKRVFDLGCGNGAFCNALSKLGYDATGVDPSEEGVRIANEAFPDIQIDLGSAYDPLHERYGQFPAVVSLEVIEHVFLPRKYAQTVADLLEPDGIAIISTPYHSYLKNLALAISGKMDSHFTALWDYGHIKFWSIKTISILFQEAGLTVERVYRVGRIPQLAKSMIILVRKPKQ